MTPSRDNNVHQLHPALLDQLRLLPRVQSPRMQPSPGHLQPLSILSEKRATACKAAFTTSPTMSLNVHPLTRSGRFWSRLPAAAGRLKQIAGGIRGVVDEGRCPLVLSDRKTHLDKLETELKSQYGFPDAEIYRLESGIGKKQQQVIRDEIDRRFLEGGRFVLVKQAK
jgi:hypothetical protein